jgi:NADPH:quinone reductase-like Zn-dependent oxidoreductase
MDLRVRPYLSSQKGDPRIVEDTRLKERDMAISDKTILVTGANRGIGQALVEEALKRGASRVYAGTRAPIVHPTGALRPWHWT